MPFGPGGPVDVVARLLAGPLGEVLGTNVIIENKPGASSNLGMGLVARADPDGYTVLIAASNLVINPILSTKIPFDIEKDFLPLVDIADTPGTFSTRPDLGVKTLSDFVELAKKSSKFSYSHAGFGTVAHLSAEYFKQKTGIDMAAVSHNGSGPAVQSLLSGSVEFCSAGLPALHGHYSKGTVVGLGVLSDQRWFDLPNVPTAVEGGFPGFVFGNLNAMLVPSKTPPGSRRAPDAGGAEGVGGRGDPREVPGARCQDHRWRAEGTRRAHRAGSADVEKHCPVGGSQGDGKPIETSSRDAVEYDARKCRFCHPRPRVRAVG